MPKMIFVNLPVADVAAATRFYQAIGCEKNEQFSDQNSASMVWSETITFQLLVTGSFAAYTPKPVADARGVTEVLIALSFDSRADVDTVAEAVAAAGGRADIRERQDMGFMYSRAVEDTDGHVLEFMWMDMSSMPA
jgi:predicted lactoylglutathione lyase